jgi:hypothetical protein
MDKIKEDPLAYVDQRISEMGHEDVDALLASLGRTEGLDDPEGYE